MGSAQVIAPSPTALGHGAPRSERADGELVDAYIAGDRRAFEELYRRYHHRVLRFCRARTRTPQAAEDIAHDVVVRALTYLEGFDRDRPMWPWLKTIARNELTDHYGSSSRTVDLTDDDLPDLDPTADEHTTWLGERHALAQAMRCLSPRDRTVLTLRYCNDWDSAELEDFFDIERPALYKLLQRARDRLHDAYEELADSKLAGLLPAPLLARVRGFTERIRSRSPGLETNLLLAPNYVEALATAATAVAIGVGLAAAGLAHASPGSADEDLPVPASATTTLEPGAAGEALAATAEAEAAAVPPVRPVPVPNHREARTASSVTVGTSTDDMGGLPATSMIAGADADSDDQVSVTARLWAYVPGDEDPPHAGTGLELNCGDSTTTNAVCAGLGILEEALPPPPEG